jgi:uncharacterized protein (TIGR04222 family)
MVGLWVMYGFGIVAGLGSSLATLIGERRIGPDAVRARLELFGSSLPAMAMLSGGPGRVVDAVLTDLVEREVVVADAGVLTVAPDSGAEGFTVAETLVIGAVRSAGAEGIRAVRREAGQVRLPFEMIFNELVRYGLLVGPRQRTWWPAGLALGVLAVLALATFGMFGNEAAYLAVLGWIPFTLLTGFFAARRRGYSGPDPRGAIGLACLARADAELPAGATQARRVALGGFAAMTDIPLRQAIKGSRADSTWPVTRRRSQASGIELLAFDLIRPPTD